MVFECARCLECCKRYWIVLLPDRARKIASFLGRSFVDFVEQNTVLYVQLFPSDFKEDSLVVSSAFFPKRVFDSLRSFFSVVPDFFLVLPSVALKRNGFCSMLDLDSGSCLIYSVRPLQCRLFPFISLNNFIGKDYLFCVGLHGFEGSLTDEQRRLQELHFGDFENYFNSVKENGFECVWSVVPKKGVLLVKDRIVGEISLSELKQIFFRE